MKTLIQNSELKIAKVGLGLANKAQPAYHQKDIEVMNDLLQLIPQRFSVPMPTKMKKAFLGKEKAYWVCTCGTDVEEHFSRCSTCSSSKFGFKSTEIEPQTVVDNLQTRLEVIMQLNAAEQA